MVQHEGNFALSSKEESILQLICNHETVLTQDLFERLGNALSVTWPKWYRRLVLTLLNAPVIHGDWLPGGFLYRRPLLVYRDTIDFRDGRLRLFRRASEADAPLPPSLIVVGHCSEGAIAIDTISKIKFFMPLTRRRMY